MITPDEAAQSLAQTGRAIEALASGIDGAAAAQRPTPDAWSVVEVVCHLADEEREDFRTRVRMTLEDPTARWPGIDPQGWVTERDYAARGLGAALAEFLAEREASLLWLRGLDADEEALMRQYVHSQYGLRAGDVLASWVAHDLLHLRQLVELRYALTRGWAEPYEVGYAGDW